MNVNRREFIKRIGIILASMAVPRGVPPSGKGGLARARVRKCWRGLDRLKKQTQGDLERDRQAGNRLKADHRAALDDLITAGELDAAVAEHVQSIFDAAVNHIEPYGETCYMMPVAPPPRSSLSYGELLFRQLDLLNEMASSGDIDPETVAQARAAIEREIMFLFRPGKLDAEATPEVAQAARFLVQLLSGQ